MLSWMRALHETYGHMYSAEYRQFADAREPRRDEHWVADMVQRSVKPLFFEAMKRWVHGGGDVAKLRLLLANMEEHETLSKDPMRFLSDEVEALLYLQGDPQLRRALALEVDPVEICHIERVPWLANELYSVTEERQNETRNAVKRKHWQICAETRAEHLR